MKNVGTADKIIRFSLGLIIGGWGIWSQNWWGLIGLVPILTAALGTCPLYVPCKMNTCKTK